MRVWCLHWADSCSQPSCCCFSFSRKAQLLVRALTAHPSAHHDFENLSWSMIPIQSWSREKKQVFTSARIRAENCSITLLSSIRRVPFLVSAFLARFCHNKPVLVILLPSYKQRDFSLDQMHLWNVSFPIKSLQIPHGKQSSWAKTHFVKPHYLARGRWVGTDILLNEKHHNWKYQNFL